MGDTWRLRILSISCGCGGDFAFASSAFVVLPWVIRRRRPPRDLGRRWLAVLMHDGFSRRMSGHYSVILGVFHARAWLCSATHFIKYRVCIITHLSSRYFDIALGDAHRDSPRTRLLIRDFNITQRRISPSAMKIKRFLKHRLFLLISHG